MGFNKISTPAGVSFFLWLIISVARVHCGLQPYYLNFPPPVPGLNSIESDFHQSKWSLSPLSNSTWTRGASFPTGTIPLIVHTWVKPDAMEGTTLQNGTVIYYVAGPWGGIRSVEPPPSTSKPPTSLLSGITSNSISDYSTFSPGGFSHTTIPQQSPDAGWEAPVIDLTTTSPNRQQEPHQAQGPWGQGHLGFGWPTATQMYDEVQVTTTHPVRSQPLGNSIPITTTSSSSTEGITTPTLNDTTTVDTIAASTNARFPVSDSVRKFRRIVAQIRAITKQELSKKVS